MVFLGIFVFCITFFSTFFVIPLCSYIAHTFRVLDIPDGKLKKHTIAVPSFGGISIVIGVLPALILFYPFQLSLLFWYLGVTSLLIIGFIDDIVRLTAFQKFLGQIGSVFLLLYGMPQFSFGLWSGYICFFLVFFISLSIINAFNLVDVMDGLAGSLIAISLSAYLVISYFLLQWSLMILIIALIAGIMAFLYYNISPAKIYLGDAGSLFFGGIFSSIPFLLPWPDTFSGYLSALGIVSVFLLELVWLICVRLYKRLPIYLGSPDHFSLVLQRKGWTKNQILVYSSCIGLVSAVISLLFAFNIIGLIPMIIFSIIGATLWFLVLIVL